MSATFLNVLSQRHSCRAFQLQPLQRERIEQMLKLAAQAPSDCNSQPWALRIFSGTALEALREDLTRHVAEAGPSLSEVAPIFDYVGCAQERRRACGWALYEAVGVTKGDRVASAKQANENFRFFGAPHLAVLSTPRAMGERAIFDAGIYLGHLLLAAQALSIGAIAQGAVAHYSNVLRRHDAAGAEDQIICAIAFGRPDHGAAANAFRTTRAGLEETVRFIDE